MKDSKNLLNKYRKVNKIDESPKAKIINPKKSTNSFRNMKNDNFQKNSNINKNLVRENENKDKDLELMSRKLTTTEESDKNSQVPKNNEEKYEKCSNAFIPQEGRHKRYLKNIDYSNKIFEKIPKNNNDKNTKSFKKNFALTINLNQTLNNKESGIYTDIPNSVPHKMLNNNNNNSNFPNSNKNKYFYISTDPNNKKIINSKVKDHNYKRNNHYQNYFYINNDLFNVSMDNIKYFDNLSNASGKTYNQPRVIKNLKFCHTPNQRLLQRNIYEMNNYYYTKVNIFFKAFTSYVEKLSKIYLLKNMYYFLYYLKNLPKIKKKSNSIFIERQKYKISTTNPNLNNSKDNLIDNVINKIKNKVVYTSTEYSNRSEMYRDYQELNKSRDKILRRKNREKNRNNKLDGNCENKFNEKNKDKVVKVFNRNRNQLGNIKNNTSFKKNVKLNTTKKNNTNKVTLKEKKQNDENKITINVKYMNMNFDSRKNKFNACLKECKEYSFFLKGKKKQITKKKSSNTGLNARNNKKLAAIKEEEEK